MGARRNDGRRPEMFRRGAAILVSGLVTCLLSVSATQFVFAGELDNDPSEVGSPALDGETSSSSSGGNSSSFFSTIFSSNETELESFKPPVNGYAELVDKRAVSVRLQMARGVGLISEPYTEEYLNRLLREILKANDIPDFGTQVYLHGDLTPSANATPDGGIFVNLNLIGTLKTEASVAFVLAHEVSHFLLKHHSSDWFVDSQHKALTGVQTLRNLSQMKGTPLEGKANLGQASEKLRKAELIGSIAFDVSDKLFFSAWGREQEDEADKLGFDLAVGAGYDPYDSDDVFTILEEHEAELQLSRDEASSALGLKSVSLIGLSEQQVESNPFFAGIAEGFGKMISEISNDHYSVSERLDARDEYLNKFYPNFDTSNVISTPWERDSAHPLNDLLKRYDAASESRKALREGRVAAAIKLASASIGERTKYHAYPRIAFFQARMAQNNASRAQKNLELAMKAEYVAPVVYEELINLHQDQGRNGKAIAVIELAEEKSGGELPLFLPHKIYSLVKLKRRADAVALERTCAFEYRIMEQSCKEALRGTKPGKTEIGLAN
ncbi:M48 family metallopeptidase [Nisaea denitrificans]|uniref:M48 family metallopeptidase n=1 Tax=Nisaea denitrificans TaxID=390877 RepID=UPI00041247EF|nr:M48 family metallopeptidase [Nisaea denitrificans]